MTSGERVWLAATRLAVATALPAVRHGTWGAQTRREAGGCAPHGVHAALRQRHTASRDIFLPSMSMFSFSTMDVQDGSRHQ